MFSAFGWFRGVVGEVRCCGKVDDLGGVSDVGYLEFVGGVLDGQREVTAHIGLRGAGCRHIHRGG